MSESKLLTGEELNKFSTLVRKRQHNKLTAAQLSNLDPISYSDYIRQIKQQARIKTHSINRQPTSKIIPTHLNKLSADNKQLPFQRKEHLKPLSFYYSDKLEIMSLKEFVIILQESKRKKQLQERACNREKQRQLVRDVGRSIQTSGSERNLRLTLSSAARINKRIKQNHYEHLF